MPSFLSITNVFDKEQKRKNRWTLKLLNIPLLEDSDPFSSDPTTQTTSIDDGSIARILQLSLLSAARPNWSIGEVEFHRLNEKYYYPEGKATFEPLEVAFYDTIGINAGRYLHDWTRAVYDPKTGAIGYKSFFTAEGRLYMLDPKGTVVEEWRLLNCWPTTVNFNDLSYEDTAAAMVNVTLRYDRAIPRFYNDPMASAPRDTAGFASDAYGIPGQDDFNQGIDGVISDYPGP